MTHRTEGVFPVSLGSGAPTQSPLLPLYLPVGVSTMRANVVRGGRGGTHRHCELVGIRRFFPLASQDLGTHLVA